MSFSIVPPHLAVKAMRDNGYKTAAHAIAELMDNSIQAGSSEVQLLCSQESVLVSDRTRARVTQVAVLDNGCGMDSQVLRIAMQFGNGTRLSEDQQDGIGRFGMGLPASSISQCRKVEVWSWQNGPSGAIYTYLSLDEIISGSMTEVPEPIKKEIPKLWCDAAGSLGSSGTLVVWSDLDRLFWRTAKAIFDNSEFIIGRMYRRFLDNGAVTIRMVGFNQHMPTEPTVERFALPNDPGYLMSGTSCPEPFHDTPMFEKWGGDAFMVEHIIRYQGRDHTVRIRYSLAKESARPGRNPGHKPHGQHARKNVGVSVVRADRELALDTSWANPSDPRERWWGIEIEFPPALDELFGVTNNKQDAHSFTEMGRLDIEELLTGGKTISELRAELEDDQDPLAPLLEIGHQIKKTASVLRAILRAQGASEESASRRRHNKISDSVEARATEVTQRRKDEGFRGESDRDEALSPDERKGILEQSLIDEGIPREIALGLAAETVNNGLKYVFTEASLDADAFFSVKQRGGSIVLTLNTNHPAYPSLVEVLESAQVEDEQSVEECQTRLINALAGLKLLLFAWARYEDEQPDGMRRNNAQEARRDWGRIAKQFLISD